MGVVISLKAKAEIDDLLRSLKTACLTTLNIRDGTYGANTSDSMRSSLFQETHLIPFKPKIEVYAAQ